MSQDISQQKDWLSAWKIFYEPEESLEKIDPNAVSISSVDSEGMPNNRIVLLKDITQDGFFFYTNNVSLYRFFYWDFRSCYPSYRYIIKKTTSIF